MKFNNIITVFNIIILLITMWFAYSAKNYSFYSWSNAVDNTFRIERIEKKLGIDPDYHEPYTPPSGGNRGQ